MIPSSPEWSALSAYSPYLELDYPAPIVTGMDAAFAITSGPAEISESKGVNMSRYWLAYQDGEKVMVKSDDSAGGWTDPIYLFNEEREIIRLSISFDQQGKPIVLYEIKGDRLTLFWFNPVTLSNERKFITQGNVPLLCFDSPLDTGQPYSDVLAFYVRGGDVYMRVQRDRFEIEYLTPAKGIYRLLSAGLSKDHRLRVLFLSEIKDFTPPPPQPPQPPEFTGDYIYMQASATQFGLEKPLINSAQHDDISIAFSFYGVNELLETLDPTWGPYGFPIFCEGGTTTTYPIPLWYNMSMYFDITGPQYGYLRETQLKASRKFSLAFMYSDNALYLILVINGKKYGPIMPFNLSDGRWTVAITGNTLTVLNDATTLFTMAVDRGQDGGSEPEPGRFGAYSLGALHNMWRQNFSGALYDITATIAGVETHYPLRTYNSATQPSAPPGNDVTIYNHKPANWKYIAG